MPTYLSLVRLITQRSRANWKLLTTIVFGMILASGLMSSVILYSDAVRDLGLDYAIRQENPRNLDIHVVSSSQKGDPSIYDNRRATTEKLMDRYAGNLIENYGYYGRSATFFQTEPGQEVSEDDLRPRANFLFIEGLDNHVELVKGTERKAVNRNQTSNSPPVIDVWISEKGALDLNVDVGKTFDLHPFWKKDIEPLQIRIVGLIKPVNPNEAFWFGHADDLTLDTTRWPTYIYIIEEAVFREVIATYLPSTDGTFETFGYVNASVLNSRNAEQIERDLRSLERDLRNEFKNTSTFTNLVPLISDYQEKLFFTRMPLFALMLLIVGIALYYLVLVMTMLIERQSGEIALLKSRGASSPQILLVYLIEGSILVALAVGLGPLLAMGAIKILGPTPPFADLSQNSFLDVHLSSGAFGLALLGAILALLALLLPAWKASRSSTILHKATLARPSKQPLFLRYYLDLILIGVGAFLFYQLRQRGSLVTEQLFGELSADPLLLISPALFILMIALVFLRLFPIALKIVARVVRNTNSATIPLSLWRMVRSPLHYSRLILLLLLATSVGMFAAGFRATLEQSYSDRAAYQSGADGRITEIRNPSDLPDQELVEHFEQLPGLENVSATARLNAFWQPEIYTKAQLELLAVNVTDFDKAAYWRKDFSDKPLSELLKQLPISNENSPEPLYIPPETRYMAIHAHIVFPNDVGIPAIRLGSKDGRYWEYYLVPLSEEAGPGGYKIYAADLTKPWQPRESPPGAETELFLDAIFVAYGRYSFIPANATATFDDLTVIGEGWDREIPTFQRRSFRGSNSTGQKEYIPLTQGTIIETFDDLEHYESIPSQYGETPPLTRIESGRANNNYAAQIAFEFNPASDRVAGIRVRRPHSELPVLVSKTFLQENKLREGDVTQIRINRHLLNINVVGSFDLFPGFDPTKDRALMIADIEAVRLLATGLPRISNSIFSDEIWIGSINRSALQQGLTKDWLKTNEISAAEAYDRHILHASLSSDPLIAASWEGILFLSFAAVLFLTALGFIVFSFLAAQTRSLEFAILRTMGFSGRQIVATVAFEQLFVIIMGVAAGTALGFPLSRLMISALSLGEGGEEVIPPFVSQISWEAILTVYGILGIVFLITVAALVRLFSRLALHRTLRIGEV